MKKIIKRGKRHFINSCDTCGCKFRYDIQDLYTNKISCPDCGNTVTHSGKGFIKENKHKVMVWVIKILIYIIVGVSIWHITAAKYKNTEKDIDENIVAEEIGEGVDTVMEIA